MFNQNRHKRHCNCGGFFDDSVCKDLTRANKIDIIFHRDFSGHFIVVCFAFAEREQSLRTQKGASLRECKQPSSWRWRATARCCLLRGAWRHKQNANN